jgi:hypothetical protein
MDYDLNFKIKTESLEIGKISQIGNDITNANLVIRTSENEKLLYLDGACDGQAPLYLGIIKSRGTQQNKLVVKKNDFLGGLQIYARTKEGKSLGYCPEETPLVAGIQFKISDVASNGTPTEMLLGLSDHEGMKIKLIVDMDGNLKITGNLSLGNLIITDEDVESSTRIEKFVKAIYNGKEYAIPLYSILGTHP